MMYLIYKKFPNLLTLSFFVTADITKDNKDNGHGYNNDNKRTTVS